MSEPTDHPPEPAPPATAKKPARRRRPQRGWWVGRRKVWLLRIGLATLLLAAIPAVLVLHYTRPHNLKPLMEGLLSRHVGGHVNIGEARLTRGGRLTLSALWVDVPGLPETRERFAKLFEAEQIEVKLDLGQLWRGEIRIDQLKVQRPQLHVIEDLDRGQLNLEMLRLPERDDDDRNLRLTLPPAIDIENGRVRFARIEGGRFETLDAMRLAGELQENPRQPGLYDFQLRQYDEQAQLDAALAGSFDATDPSLHLRLDGFQIATVHRQFVPPGFRAWWDQLRPAGRLPNLTVTMDSGEDGRLRLDSAVLELDNVSITPPYDELGGIEPDDQPLAYRPRMTEVSGRFVVDRDSVRLEDVTGRIEGVRYYASGRWGFGDAAAGSIAVSTDPFTLDRDPDFVAALPMIGEQVFGKLKPSGTFQASTRFVRPAAGEPIEVSGVLKLLGARVRYHKFPYPLTNLQGLVSFDRSHIRVEGVTGEGPGGGTVKLDGAFWPPGDDPAVRLHLAVRALPFDDTLLASFQDDDRDKILPFVDADLHRALIDEGVIRSGVAGAGEADAAVSVDPDAEEGPIPGLAVFDPGGWVHADLLIERPAGPGHKPRVTTVLDVAGMSVLFRGFPYPLTGESGRVIVRPGRVTLDDVRVIGPTGGRAVLRGQVVEDPQQPGRMRPDLRVQDADLPIDAVLRHAIRHPARQTVSDLNLTGRLTGEAHITAPAETSSASASASETAPRRGADWRVEAATAGASLNPYAGCFTLHDVAARFTLDQAGLTLHEFSGRRGDAAYAGRGRFDWSAGHGVELRLQVEGERVALEPALLDVLPPDGPVRARLAALYETHRPEGRLDGRLVWTDHTADPDAGDFRLDLQPDVLRLDYADTRFRLDALDGRLLVTPGQVEIDELAVMFPTGRSTLDGKVGFDGQTATALTFTAEADTHCPYTRQLIPAAVRTVLDELQVDGDYRLTDARLLVRPAPAAGQTAVEFDAELDLDDVSLTLGVPVTAMHGRLETRVRRYPDDPHPRLQLDLDAQRLRVSDRLVSPLQMTLHNDAEPGRLRLDRAIGGVYGGVLVLDGSLPLVRTEPYRLQLTLSDVAVESFLRPGDADEPPRPIHAPETPGGEDSGWPRPFSNLERDLNSGLLSASLALEAPLNDATQRRGRGALLVRDARLVDRPLAIALLRATSFALPSGAPLESASARYLIDGADLQFDELTLTGPGLEISGTGGMTMPDTRLDLVMTSSNTGGLRLGPISDLIDLFKDELITIRVTGTLAEPHARVVPFSGLTSGWRDTFGRRGATIDTRDNLVGE
jgi:hypothetical protein